MFIVQGEGRGHMTQAITLYELLIKAGHEVSYVFVGKSNRREIPSFFFGRIKCPIEKIYSPNFITDKDNKSIRLRATVWKNLVKSHQFISSLIQINRKVKETQPDVIINFYDFLGGLYYLLLAPKIKYVCIGHQYMASHPEFEFAAGHFTDKFLLRFNNALTSLKSNKNLALSFGSSTIRKHKRTVLIPPLLRKEVKELAVTQQPYILCYMVNSGYSTEIIRWHEQNPDVKLHCFWDDREAPEVMEHSNNLTFHKINDKKFLSMMKDCQAYVSTAGFESICEAMYFNKPVLMIPVKGQYEQACNAIDAKKANAGIVDNWFNISKLIDYIPHHSNHAGEFQQWVSRTDSMILQELTQFEETGPISIFNELWLTFKQKNLILPSNYS